MSLPLVTCIMPTIPCRKRFVEHAVRLFNAQQYPNKELIVVDDGEFDSVADVIDAQENIEYIYIDTNGTERGLTIGAKRNLALSIAQGELICTMDDDDWFGPDRLMKQALPILSGDADLTAMKMSCVYHFPTGRLWRISDSLHKRLFPHDVRAGTLMYKASLLKRNIFYPNVSRGEDAWFLNRLLKHGGRLEQVVDPHSYICVRHGGNVTPEMEYGPPEWEEEDVREYFGEEDLAFYEVMRAANAQVAHLTRGREL